MKMKQFILTSISVTDILISTTDITTNDILSVERKRIERG